MHLSLDSRALPWTESFLGCQSEYQVGESRAWAARRASSTLGAACL